MPAGIPALRRLDYIVLSSLIFIIGLSNSGHAQSTSQFPSQPVASAQCNAFTFDATASHDPDNESLAFYWDFGDGHTSTDPIVQHVYSESGLYDVTLSISDNSGLECSTSMTTRQVKVNIPPFASFTGADMVCANEPITLDASASYSDHEGGIMAYRWDFGDNTQTSGEKIVTKTYANGGTYKVSLKVNDNRATQCSSATAEEIIYVNEPPVADAGEEIILRCVEGGDDMVVAFDASGSNDANNDPLSYLWDFGDGYTASGVTTSHRFADVTNYDVKLIVKDNTQLSCSAGVDFVTVRFSKAPKANAGEDILACAGDPLVFDGSQSYAFKPGTLNAKWQFGDGESAQGLKVNHTYQKPGVYQASLTVENELNAMCPPSTDTRQVTVNASPKVSISMTDKTCVGNTVHFDAAATSDQNGDTLEYYWTFGDGTIQRGGPKVSHQYLQGGTYRVSVIVDDGKGTACSTATAAADILVNTPPIADAGPNLSCCMDKPTEFNATHSSDPDGDNLTYTWQFGDGQSKEGAIVNHVYKKSGSYNVQLTVNDNSGTACSTASTGYVAEVNAAPVPVMNIR